MIDTLCTPNFVAWWVRSQPILVQSQAFSFHQGSTAGQDLSLKGRRVFCNDSRVLLKNPKGLSCDSPRGACQRLQTAFLSQTSQVLIGSAVSRGPRDKEAFVEPGSVVVWAHSSPAAFPVTQLGVWTTHKSRMCFLKIQTGTCCFLSCRRGQVQLVLHFTRDILPYPIPLHSQKFC